MEKAFFLRVQFNAWKVIFSAIKPGMKFGELRDSISSMFTVRMGKTVRIINLMDELGYCYPDEMVVMDFLERGSVVTCRDELSLFQISKNNLVTNDSLVTFERPDFVDNKKKYFRFGYTKDGKCFAQLWNGNIVSGFRLIEFGELMTLTGEEKILFARAVDNWKCALSASKVGETKFLVKVQLKSKSDPSDAILLQEIQILDGKASKVGEAKVEEPKEAPLVTLHVPKDVKTGDTEMKVETHPTPVVHPTSEGDSAIELKVVPEDGKVPTRVVHGRQVGTNIQIFFNLFNVTVQNTTNEDMSGTFAAEWKDKDGAWKPCGQTQVGACFKNRYNSWDARYDGKNNFNIGKNEVVSLAMNCRIDDIEGKMGRNNTDRVRIPPSVTQPLCVRFTMTDVKNRKRSVIAEHCNKPKVHMSLEKFKNDRKSYISHFIKLITCDDVKKEERNHVGVFVNKKKEVQVYGSNRYFTMDATFFRKKSFEASSEKTKEKDLGLKGSYFEVHGLFSEDHNYQIFGLKIIVTSETGKSEGYVSIPFDLL